MGDAARWLRPRRPGDVANDLTRSGTRWSGPPLGWEGIPQDCRHYQSTDQQHASVLIARSGGLFSAIVSLAKNTSIILRLFNEKRVFLELPSLHLLTHPARDSAAASPR